MSRDITPDGYRSEPVKYPSLRVIDLAEEAKAVTEDYRNQVLNAVNDSCLRLAAQGVTVNAIAPGLIDTEMGKPLIEAGIGARIPVGRPGTGEEIAQAVLLLVGNAFVTGQTIAVNGGALFT